MLTGKKHAKKGYTLVELTMSIAILGIVLMGVILLIKYVMQGTWSIMGGMTINTEAKEAMDFIAKDFRTAKASTMGNIAPNAGFEDPIQMGVNPTGWEALAPDVEKNGYSGTGLKSGRLSIKISNGASYRNAAPFTMIGNKQYIVSTWAKGLARFNLVKPDNSDLTAPVAANNAYWTHIVTPITFGVDTQAKVKLAMPSPTNWIMFPQPPWQGNVIDVTDMAVYKNKVYVGVWETGATYVYDDTGGTFSANTAIGINPNVNMMCVYNFPDGVGERLLVCGGMWDWGNSTSWTYWDRYSFNGTTWFPNAWPTGAGDNTTYAVDSAWSTGRYSFRCSAQYAGKLYIGTCGYTVGGYYAQIREYDPARVFGSRWRVLYASTTENMFTTMCVYTHPVTGHVLLFAGTANGSVTWHIPWGTGSIYIYDITSDVITNGGNPIPPSPSAVGHFTDMVVFNNKLYAVAGTALAGELYEYDGLTGAWRVDSSLGACLSLCVYKNKLYLGTWNGTVRTSTDGNIWAAISNIAPTSVKRMVVCNNRLYAGGAPMGWGIGTTNVYIYGDETYFDDVSVSPADFVFDNNTVVGTNDTYTYFISQGTADTDVDRYKLYRLRYSPSSQVLYREYSPNGGTTWVPKGLTPEGIICHDVQQLRIINHDQESFEVELTLEKAVQAGKTKKIIIRNIFKPAIS